MTYEELLAKISELNKSFNHPDSVFSFNDIQNKALRAVVELHKPEPTSNGEPGCPECVKLIRVDDKAMTYRYPCPTIQAIEKELI